MSFNVTLSPSEKVIKVDEQTNLLEALRNVGIYIKSSCGGHASCSDCIVKIAEGTDNVAEPTFEEVQLLGNVFHITKERLACQTLCTGDITLDLSHHDESVDKEKLRSKTSSQYKNFKGKTKTRKKEDVQAMYEERNQMREERQANDKKWFKHWEKEEGKSGKQGGFKKPQLFNTDIDYDDETSKEGERTEKKRQAEDEKFKPATKDFKPKGPKNSAFPKRKKSDS